MNVCFGDTAYYLALISADDDAHKVATDFTQGYAGVIVTTSAVLNELGNHLRAPVNRPVFMTLLRQLQADPDVQIVHVDPQLFKEGTTLFEQRLDQHWSLTDCISFAVMNRQGLTDALTTDHHFRQAGFNLPLQP